MLHMNRVHHWLDRRVHHFAKATARRSGILSAWALAATANQAHDGLALWLSCRLRPLFRTPTSV